jgi:hypothetical protein
VDERGLQVATLLQYPGTKERLEGRPVDPANTDKDVEQLKDGVLTTHNTAARNSIVYSQTYGYDAGSKWYQRLGQCGSPTTPALCAQPLLEDRLGLVHTEPVHIWYP